MVSALVLAIVVLLGAAAPLWADHVAHRGPADTNETGTADRGGRAVDVVSLEGVPIGPAWGGEYLLGADPNGRDVMVRLLYAARNSLLVGVTAALAACLAALVLGTSAGYLRGWVDAVIAPVLDVIWAFPVILLGVALGTLLAVAGLEVGPVRIESGSLFVPVVVIAIVYVPYAARPIRAEVMALAQRGFVEAARAQGAGPLRIITRELLPNLATLLVVLVPLMIANAILLEAGLSFLGIGVTDPDASWGNMIDQGAERLTSAAHLALAPGLMLAVTLVALNLLADRVRDAIDPRAGARLGTRMRRAGAGG